MIARYGNVLFTLHGHTHKHEITEPYQDNIPYINTYGVQQQSFYIIQISNDEFNIETVVF